MLKLEKTLKMKLIQKALNQIENDDMILDVGSKTIQNMKKM